MWLIDFVENLLYATRIEEGKMTLRTSTELLSEIVEEAIWHIKRKLDSHTLSVSFDDDLILVKADAKLLVQVIANTPPQTLPSLLLERKKEIWQSFPSPIPEMGFHPRTKNGSLKNFTVETKK